MLTAGTSSPVTNPAARFDRLPSEALRKPTRYADGAYSLLPRGRDLANSCVKLATTLKAPFKKRRPHLAEDLDQVADMALVRAAAHYDPNRGTVFATLAGFAVGKACQELVRQDRPRGYRKSPDAPPSVNGLGDLDVPTDDPTTAIERAEDLEIVGTVMARLGPKLADVLRRRHLEGQTLQQVGEVYGVTKERIRQLELQAAMKIRESGIAG